MLKRFAEKLKVQIIGDHRQRLLRKMPRNSVCAEIGVWKGEFSQQILRVVKPIELHLIDPWKYQPDFPERMYGGSIAKKQEDMDQVYLQVKKKFENNHKVKIARGYSEEVMAEYVDEYFDWVYIDGNHYYDFVKKDLELAFLKVKKGGLITGDDYNWGGRKDIQ
jgi:hypothetical protein